MIFGIHMVMQTIIFNILTMQLIKEIYNIIMSFNVVPTYQAAINIFSSHVWITINVVKMIVFNLLCEEISGKVSFPEVFRIFGNACDNRVADISDKQRRLKIDVCKHGENNVAASNPIDPIFSSLA